MARAQKRVGTKDGSKRVQQTRLGDKRVYLLRQMHLSPETNACRTCLRYTLPLTSTVYRVYIHVDITEHAPTE